MKLVVLFLLTVSILVAGCTTTQPVVPPAGEVLAVQQPPVGPGPGGVSVPAPAATNKVAPPPKEVKIQHAAIGAQVTASSTNMKFPEEKPASALVDGDLSTRWSSDYSGTQNVVVVFAKELKVSKVRLHWENATASKYTLSISVDGGKTWEGQHAFFKPDAKPEPRVDEIKLNGLKANALRLDLLGRVNPEWGYSMYEIEVQGE